MADAKIEPKEACSTVLTGGEEASSLALRRYTLLLLGNGLKARQPTILHLTRSSLHRCHWCDGISHLPELEGDKPT